MAESKDQAEAATEALYRVLSTNSNPQFLLEKLIPKLEYADGSVWIDPMHPQFERFLSLPRLNQFEYNSSMPITTQSFQIYGTTSLWWLILCCSEAVHPHCIPNKAVILVPTAQAIVAQIKKSMDRGIVGSVVTI